MIKTGYALLFFALFLSAGKVFAQPRYQVFDFRDPKLRTFSVYAQLGTANYFGDLCPTGDCYANSKFSGGGGLSYRMNDYLFFSFNLQYYRIGGSDLESGNASRLKRNLSFRADNFEFSFLGHFEFLNYNSFRYLTRREFPISMFIYTGFGITTNNPMAQAEGSSDYIALRPLKTEGSAYSPVAAILPIGLGISYKVLNNLELSLMAGYRFTSTDYLDDVSGKYADPANLPSDESRYFANRSLNQVVKNPDGTTETVSTWFGPGSRRGNSVNNDGYLLFNFKVEYNLPHVPFLNFAAGRKTVGTKRGKVSSPSNQIKKK
jgi:hypothetical protein